MKKILLLIFLALTLTSCDERTSVFYYRDGNKLHSELNGTNVEQLVAEGYILGVVDTSSLKDCENMRNVKGGQLFDTVKNYLKSNPEIRQHRASYIVESIIKEKFNCK
jgi:hypothetical protein